MSLAPRQSLPRLLFSAFTAGREQTPICRGEIPSRVFGSRKAAAKDGGSEGSSSASESGESSSGDSGSSGGETKKAAEA